MHKLLSKNAVAELLGCHPETVMRMSRQGRFARPVKFHRSTRGRVRFDEAHVIRWIEESKLDIAEPANG